MEIRKLTREEEEKAARKLFALTGCTPEEYARRILGKFLEERNSDKNVEES